MSIRKWNLIILILFILFASLLLSFLISVLHIRELVKPLSLHVKGVDDPLRIVLISQELDNPYWRSIEQGARDASQQYEMDLDYMGPFRINPEEQIKLLEKSLTKKVDAILIQGIDDPQYRTIITEASALGIPIITLDTDEPQSQRLYYVGTDNFQAGKRMGELVLQASSGQGSIGVLLGEELAYNQQLRLDGFRSVIARYPELKIIDVRSSHISRLLAAKQTEEILLGHPETKYLVGFSALDGLGMLDAKKRIQSEQLQIFAFDDLEETLDGIRSKQITSTIVQQPYTMGYVAISILNDYFSGELPPQQHFTDTFVIDPSTIHSYEVKEKSR